MASVTQRIKQIKQPYGGYLSPHDFTVKTLPNKHNLNEKENINAATVGLVVDYLTRFLLNHDKEESFKISLTGAYLAQQLPQAVELLKEINGLDNKSIIAACKLVRYDSVYRSGRINHLFYRTPAPNLATIQNIKIMVERSLEFFKLYGPMIQDGFNLDGAYTPLVNAGDGDFLTASTLWDFKVSKYPPNSKYTLQVLMYYLMGLRSNNKIKMKGLKYLGFYNPRLNKVFTIEIDKIKPQIIKEVEDKVIGYKKRS